jgi:MFS transporter, ACS family, hexuronate transporter
VWAVWWMASYHSPGVHPRLSEAERDLIATRQPPKQEEARMSWIGLFRFPQVWGLVTAKFMSDAAWYFYLFWLPKYLYEVRHFDTKQVGYYAWIPYAASGLGSITGGWFSSFLIRRGHSLNFARKVALGASAAVMPLIVLVTQSPVQVAIVLFSIAFAGQQSWSTLVMIVPADIFPPRAVGSVAGLVGFGGAMGGVVFGLVVGYLLDHGFGYGTVFGIVGTFHVIAFFIILLTVRVIAPLGPGAKTAEARAI